MTSISKSWDRIHNWLEQRAPKILASLNKGASDSEIAAVENFIGRPLPTDWRELYAIHDGLNDESQGSLFHGMNFLNLRQVQLEVTRSRESSNVGGVAAVKKADTMINSTDIYCDGWIPFAHDWGELLLRVDLVPESTGNVGQVIFTDYAYNVAGLVAPSLSSFLNAFANDLDSDQYFLNANALENGDEFLDCTGDIDVANWWKSPRWKHLET